MASCRSSSTTGPPDGSGELAARLGAQVLHESRRGVEAACFAGLLAARKTVVWFMDADGSLDPRELPRLAPPHAADHADLVLGARAATVAGAWAVHTRAVNRLRALELVV